MVLLNSLGADYLCNCLDCVKVCCSSKFTDFVFEDHSSKDHADTPHVNGVIIGWYIQKQFWCLEASGSEKQAVILVHVEVISKTPVD